MKRRPVIRIDDQDGALSMLRDEIDAVITVSCPSRNWFAGFFLFGRSMDRCECIVTNLRSGATLFITPLPELAVMSGAGIAAVYERSPSGPARVLWLHAAGASGVSQVPRSLGFPESMTMSDEGKQATLHFPRGHSEAVNSADVKWTVTGRPYLATFHRFPSP